MIRNFVKNIKMLSRDWYFKEDRSAEMLAMISQIATKFEEVRDSAYHLRKIGESLLINATLAADGRYADPKSLSRHNRRMYSQHGEDGIISEIFNRIETKDKAFMEIGVGNGRENTTRFLLEQGWHGTWFEGSPEHVESAKEFMREYIADGRLKIVQSFITAENVNELADEAGVPKDLDYISVDIDYNTSHVWRSLNRRGRVACIEQNCTMPPNTSMSVPYDPSGVWDGSAWYGASLKAMEIIGSGKDMALVGCDLVGVNAYFVNLKEAIGKFREPFDAETHYEPPRYYFMGQQHKAPDVPRKWIVD